MTTEQHPLLTPAARDDRSAAFFDASAAGLLLIKRCARCSTALPGDALLCTSCHETHVHDELAGGQGRLVSWTVLAPRRGSEGKHSDVVGGIVELDEGPWIVARVNVAQDRLRVGLPVTVSFARSGDEQVPTFGECP